MKQFRKSLLYFCAGLALLLWVTPVAGQTAVADPPTILSNEALVNYPNDVLFSLTLPADTPVTQATLRYDVATTACLEAAAQVPVPLTVDEDGVTAVWTWAMVRSGNPPPGAVLWWEWVLRDANGQETTTPRQSLIFHDNRFNWQTISDERITLHWYRGDVGPMLLEAAVAGLSRLEEEMGISLQNPVQFYIYGSAADMREAVLYVQDWAGGLAFSDYNTILIGVEPASAAGWGRNVVRHELAHLVTGQFAHSCVGGRRPTWLEEGLAVYAEGEPTADTQTALTLAQANDSFAPLRSLSGAFPAHSERAGSAYAQSYSVVEFMLRAYGREKLQMLLLTLADGQGIDPALEQVYGFNTDGLEAAWRADRGLAERPFPATPTPISAAAVPTIAPLGRPESVPTPAAAAPPQAAPGSGICGFGLVPLAVLGWASLRRGRRWPSVWILLALVGLLPGCQLLNLGPASLAGVNRDEAIVLMSGQPQTLDPALTRGGPDSPLGHIFSGLVTLDTALQVQPELAAGWQISDDGLVYTFYLRPNAVFHNGRALTAQDVIYSWERATDPATGSDTAQTYLGDILGVAEKLAGQADQISGLRALDDHTLEVTLTAPVVYFLAKLAYPVAYVVDRENVSRPGWEYAANGSGPFRLARWDDDQLLLLARFEEYYLEPARVAHLVYDLGPGLPLARYETGELDLVGIGGANLEQARDPNNRFSQELRTAVSLCTSALGLDNRRPPFDDPLVRQAFNYALDKNLLIETFANGNALPARGPLPPGMPGYGLSQVAGYPYDPAQAQALLAQAGYRNMDDFPVLTYYTTGYGDVGGYATAVITLWQENLGVTIEPVVLDPFTYYDELYSGNVGHIFSSGWCADYPDPQNFLDVLYHSGSRQNIGGFADAAIDELLEAARVEGDVTRRLALYAEAERQIVAAAPVVFTTHGLSAVLVQPDVQNYTLTPLGVRQWHRVWRE